MFPITLTLHNTAQLNAVMAALQSATGEPTTAELVQIAQKRATENAAAQVEKPAKSTNAKTTASDAPTKPTAEVAADAAPEKTGAASNPAAGNAEAERQASTAANDVTYDQVAKAITEQAKVDRGHVVEVLGQFGVKKGTELKPAQYADFLQALAA